MSPPCLSFSNALKLKIIFVVIIAAIKTDGGKLDDGQKLFRRAYKGYRPTDNILSKFKVLSWLDCAFHCLDYANRMCKSFNHKPFTKPNEPNCEVNGEQPGAVINLATERDWTFYQVQSCDCHFGYCTAMEHCDCSVLCDKCTDPNYNFAMGKPTLQSSTYNTQRGYGSSHLAVDGKTETRYYNPQTYRPQCAHTYSSEIKPWWKVDFGEQVPVARVVFTKEVDCCSSNMRDFEIKVGDNPLNNGLENPKCGDRHSAVAETTNIKCIPIMFGRYLVIQQQLPSTPLAICELEVYCQ